MFLDVVRLRLAITNLRRSKHFSALLLYRIKVLDVERLFLDVGSPLLFQRICGIIKHNQTERKETKK